jgi:hypothetical protein
MCRGRDRRVRQRRALRRRRRPAALSHVRAAAVRGGCRRGRRGYGAMGRVQRAVHGARCGRAADADTVRVPSTTASIAKLSKASTVTSKLQTIVLLGSCHGLRTAVMLAKPCSHQGVQLLVHCLAKTRHFVDVFAVTAFCSTLLHQFTQRATSMSLMHWRQVFRHRFITSCVIGHAAGLSTIVRMR